MSVGFRGRAASMLGGRVAAPRLAVIFAAALSPLGVPALVRAATITDPVVAAAGPTVRVAAPWSAQASGNADFVGVWASSAGGFEIKTENLATGACTGTSDFSGYTLTDCQVSGASYVFTVNTGASYHSYNSGTIKGNSVTGSFHDTNGTTESYTATRAPVSISGTVYGVDCGDSSCSRSGLAGATIVVTGTASDGSAVTEGDVSAADGSWSVGVPPGSYTVGPSQDGKTIDGAGFDPETATVNVGSQDVSDENFSTCALDQQLGAAGDPGAAVRPSGRLLAYAAAAPAPSTCKSIYTIQVSAKIPQPRLVDPSSKAPYEVNSGRGYNPSTDHPHALSPGFPACFSASEVAADTKAGATAEWYTYIKGGKLGSVSASFAWNRKTQEVHLVDGPMVTSQKLTRMFVWRMKIGGAVKHGSCPETNEVPVLTLPVGGADVGSGSLTAREFSLITVWGFPFEPTGVRVDPNTLLERGKNVLRKLYSPVKLYDNAIEKLVGLLPFYHSLNKLGRFGVEFGASFALGTGFVKAVAAAPAAASRFFAAAKYLPQLVAGLEAAEKLSHTGHHINSLREFVGFVSGLASQGEYPVMGAVIRGRFLVSGYHTVGNEQVPLDSMLGLSVKTTNFPTISVSVSRDAEANLDPNNPVTTGPNPLPWASMSSRQLDIYNKLSSNPAYLITNAAATHYADGLHGVHEIHADTSQTPELTKAVERHAEEETDFAAEATEAALPNCGAFTGIPDVGTSICYKFDDGKP